MELQSIRIRRGEAFSLSLNYRGLSGYKWEYTIDNEKIARVEKVGNPGEQSGFPAKIAGTPDENFKIHAMADGNATILFQQSRAWEKSKPPHDEMILLVRVIS